MGTLLTTGSILAAFFAGAVALFSPCCIVFLFPAYLASAVKNRRWALLPLTFVFALGLAAVLLPVTLGVNLVLSSVRRFHTPLYVAGGTLMIALGVLALLGRSWSLPHFARTPNVERGDSASVFALGAFSGVASSCCAPVMASVMALSALASTPIGAASLGLAYVFGMVFPLFVLALLWDRFKLGERRLLQARPVRLRVLGRVVNTNTVNLAVAVGFALMGGFVLLLALNGNTTGAPGFQLAIGRWLTRVSQDLLRWLDPLPEPLLGFGLLAMAVLFFVAAARRRGADTSAEAPSEDRHEHEEGQEAEPSPLAATSEHGSAPPSCH